MKNNLDFNTEIPHHDDESATLGVDITNYADGPVMTLSGPLGPISTPSSAMRISLNRKELETLLAILDGYEEAQKIMEGKAP